MADIRIMTIEDYEGVHDLWMSIKGFSIRSLDDSFEGVKKFLERNPDTSIVAEQDGEIIGAILCGHDGRRGTFYHVCVKKEHRMKGIGKSMVVKAMNALKKEKINKTDIIKIKALCFKAQYQKSKKYSPQSGRRYLQVVYLV